MKKFLLQVGNFIVKNWGLILFFLIVSVILFLIRKGDNIIIQENNKDLIEDSRKTKLENGKLAAELKHYKFSYAEALNRADSLRKVIGLKPGEITGVDELHFKIDTHYITTKETKYIDTGTNKPFYVTSYNDRWINISALAGKDTGRITFKQFDTIHRIEYTKPRIIGKDRRYVTIINDNQHSSLSSGYSWSVKQKEPIVTIGPALLYDPFNKKLSVGISVQVPLLKFGRR